MDSSSITIVVGIPGSGKTSILESALRRDPSLQVLNYGKAMLDVAHPVVGGLANEWVSYILSEEAYRTGRYEASVSFYGEKLGPTIVQGALAGVANLK